jgi:hypothetical protein
VEQGKTLNKKHDMFCIRYTFMMNFGVYIEGKKGRVQILEAWTLYKERAGQNLQHQKWIIFCIGALILWTWAYFQDNIKI